MNNDDGRLSERLLECTRLPDGTEIPCFGEPWGVDCALLREAADLARRWEGAESAEVGHVCTDDAGAECHLYRREKFPNQLVGQRVRIVVEGYGDGRG